MPSLVVVPAIQIGRQLRDGLGPRRPGGLMHQFGLQGREEALHDRVVPTVAAAAAALALAVLCLRGLSVTLVIVGLAAVVILLPLLMPNGRWLIGCVGFFAITIGCLAANTDDSW